MSGEFDLIARHFTRTPRAGSTTLLGVGDDCALLRPSPGTVLAVSSDMLVEGRHFVSTVAPERLGHKALAVNLSDLAAAGADPMAFVLALALPRADDAFLSGFARGLYALADEHAIDLVGGDMTAGPLTICITVFGQVPTGSALLRSGARPGDDLWVSGTLGDARLALEVLRGRVALPGAEFEDVRQRMEQPSPRVALGQALRGVASSAIDLSDGLIGDLGHVLQRSGVAALLDLDALPRSAILGRQSDDLQRECLLAGGDDYEMLFTAPADLRDAVRSCGARLGLLLTRCGRIEDGTGLHVVDGRGRPVEQAWRGFDHFA